MNAIIKRESSRRWHAPWLLLLWLLSLGLPAKLEGSAAYVVYSEARVWGNWVEEWVPLSGGGPTRFSDVFDVHSTGGSSLETWIGSAPHGWYGARVIANPFSIWLGAFGAPAYLWLEDDALGNVGYSGLLIKASSLTQFMVARPVHGFTMIVEAYWNYWVLEQGLHLSLWDRTAAQPLVEWQWNSEWGRTETPVRRLSLDPQHQYELRLYGWIVASDAKDAWLGLTFCLEKDCAGQVPEAHAAVVFAFVSVVILGLRGVLVRRRSGI